MVIIHSNFDWRTRTFVSKFCAEPHPDVTENVISNLASSTEISGDVTTKSQIASLQAQAINEFAKALQTSGSSLIKRTQGSQILRDGLYNLCQAYINGVIPDSKTFIDAYMCVLKDSVRLIEQELPLMYQQSRMQSNSRTSNGNEP